MKKLQQEFFLKLKQNDAAFARLLSLSIDLPDFLPSHMKAKIRVMSTKLANEKWGTPIDQIDQPGKDLGISWALGPVMTAIFGYDRRSTARTGLKLTKNGIKALAAAKDHFYDEVRLINDQVELAMLAVVEESIMFHCKWNHSSIGTITKYKALKEQIKEYVNSKKIQEFPEIPCFYG